MPYFRYSFLNGLRDELYLTQTRQRVTLIALLSLLIPIAGLALGSTWGSGTHRWIKQIIGAGIGCGSGIFVAWLLPRLLWNMLRLFVRKGWFLLPEKAPSEDRPEAAVITVDEFSARSKALEREEFRKIFLFAAVIVGLGLGMERVANYIDRTKPEVLIQILEGIGMVSFMAALVLWCMRMKKQLFWKHGLICWACGRKITDAAGLVRVPDRGLCKHCGAEVVSMDDSESLARY